MWQIVCITITLVGEKWQPCNCLLLSEGMCIPSLTPTKDDMLGILYLRNCEQLCALNCSIALKTVYLVLLVLRMLHTVATVIHQEAR